MNILFIDSTHTLLPKLLEEAGFKCDQLTSMKSKDEYLPIISNYDGCIIRSKFFIDSEFLDHATKLKFIGRVGSGMEVLMLKQPKHVA